MHEVEHFFYCPYCSERISMLIDVSVDEEQTYVEDCEVCCRPIEVVVSCEEGAIVTFQSSRS